MKTIFMLLTIVFVSSCIPDEPPAGNVQVSKSKLENGVIEVEGEGLDLVSAAKLTTDEGEISLSVLSKSASKLTLAAKQSASLILNGVVNLVVSNALGQATYPLVVTLPDGSVGLAQLDLDALDDRYSSGTHPPSAACPEGFVFVPGDAQFSTKDFCVMKYEAKSTSKGVVSKASALPHSGMTSQLGAMSLCQNLGAGFALINNAQWMTVATNITSVATNWSGGSVGDGAINRGHSDGEPAQMLAASTDDDACFATGQSCDGSTWNAQKRTHTLSNGQVVWDFAGNAWEWVAYQVFDGKIGASASWRKLSNFSAADNTEQMLVTDLKPLSTTHSFWNDTWDEAQGLGRYSPSHQKSGGAALRGGSVFNGAYSGVFTLFLNMDATAVDRVTGFRCVYNL